MFTDKEKEYLRSFLAEGGAVRDALKSYCADRAEHEHKDCADAMRRSPADVQGGIRAAARAEAFSEFMQLLGDSLNRS